MAAAMEPGTVLAGHRIERLLGRGGMGVVYRALEPESDRLVALKVIAPELAGDVVFRRRFEREARLARRIDHPHALPVHEAGEVDGVLFLSMRYVDGTDLEALIGSAGALPPRLAAAFIAQVGGALYAAHELGLVHRDVKPANVLVDRAADGVAHAWLTDFGLTKAVGSKSGLTRTALWVGTVDYAAPEQLQGGEVDARADVYALGCVLFEALTGHVPFPRDREVSKIMAHIREPPPAVTAVAASAPPAFDAIVRRAMAKDPAQRHASASAFRYELNTVMDMLDMKRRSRVRGSGALRTDDAKRESRDDAIAQAFTRSRAPQVLLKADGTIAASNRAFAKLIGLEGKQVDGLELGATVLATFVPGLSRAVRQVHVSGKATERRAKVSRDDGAPLELIVWLFPLPVEGSEIHMILRIEEL